MDIIFGILGLLIVSAAIWFKNERWQDYLFIIGGILLTTYSIKIDDLIFTILQLVFILSATVELIKRR